MYLLKRNSADKKLRRRQTGSGPKEICTLPYGMCVVGYGERGGEGVNLLFLLTKLNMHTPVGRSVFLQFKGSCFLRSQKEKQSLVV